MKFGKVGQVGLVSGLALGLASLFTACGTLNIGFLFVATTKQTPGQIEVYEINSESGAVRVIPTSPFPSGGRNPVAEAVSPKSFSNFYVANEDDNNIVQFGIGSDGKLYPQSTINTPGSYPVALAINAAETFAYVVDTLGPVAGCSLASPCPGVIAGYAVTPSKASVNPGSLGQSPANCTSAASCTLGNPLVESNGLTYLPLQLSAADQTVLTPTAMHIAANGTALFVAAYNSALSPSQGYLFAFKAGSDGTLTPLPIGPTYQFKGQPVQMIPLPVGNQPIALASDSTSANLFVADEAQNRIEVFSLASSGLPTLSGTYTTGDRPSALALLNDKFLYVTNSLDSTITAYGVSSGSLTKIADFATDTNPVAMTLDPRGLGFLYTVNFLGNSLSGLKIDTNTGRLINTVHSPYASSAQPLAISGIPHSGATH